MKTIIISVVIGFSIIIFLIQGVFLLVGPDYKEGEYTMVYRVYYPNNPKEYTYNKQLADWR